MARPEPDGKQPAATERGHDRHPQTRSERTQRSNGALVRRDVSTPTRNAQLPLTTGQGVADTGNAALLVSDFNVGLARDVGSRSIRSGGTIQQRQRRRSQRLARALRPANPLNVRRDFVSSYTGGELPVTVEPRLDASVVSTSNHAVATPFPLHDSHEITPSRHGHRRRPSPPQLRHLIILPLRSDTTLPVAPQTSQSTSPNPTHVGH